MSEGSAQGGEEMKKIGDYTVRGRLAPNEIKRIQLFDGRFDTAYRIVTFEIATDAPSVSGADASIIASTEDYITSNDWDWGDNRQIAWALYLSQGSDTGTFPRSFVDPDNLIVEDLFLNAFVAAGREANYLITMEKYDITDWQGALAMVRNRSQS